MTRRLAPDPDPGEAAAGARPLHHRVEDGLLVVLMAALVGLAFAQILLRNLLGIAWLWAEPLVRHLVLWASFVGAAIATRDRSHIRIDALLRLLPPPWRTGAAAFGDAVAAGVCAILAHAAVRFVLDERTYGGAAFLQLPRWSLELVFPLVFAGMGLRFAAHAVAGIAAALRQRPSGQDSCPP